MTRVVYLSRRGETILKGHGVSANFDDGSSYVLEGEHHAPDGYEYCPFFHDPRPHVNGPRQDLSLDYFGRRVNHMYPKEAVAQKMAKQLIEAGVVHPDEAERVVKHGIMNGATHRMNEKMRAKGRHNEVAPTPWDDNMQLHDDYKHMTVAPSYQDKSRLTHEREIMTEYGEHGTVPFNYYPGTNKETGQKGIESAAQPEWREGQEELAERGYTEHTSCYNKSHVEPGTITGHNVHRHQASPSGGGTVPGGHTPRGAQETYNQTRELPVADPVNILFDKNGSPKLPPAFWLRKKTNSSTTIPDKLRDDYNIQDPELLDAMAHSAVGQLLVGSGDRPGGRVNTLVKKLGKELDIEGENAQLFEQIHSNIQPSTTWKGRAAKVGRNLAAMIHLAQVKQIDLSEFDGVSEDQVSAGPQVIEAWQRIAPQVGQRRGGAEEGYDWDAPTPEQAHPSARLPVQAQAISDGPAIHSPLPRTPERAEPAEEAPPITPFGQRGSEAPHPFGERDPTMRIFNAMESMQLAIAREDTAILKYLPTKRDLNIHNAQDVNLMASRLGITSGDIHGLYASGGDWQHVAKEFRVAPSLVAAIKVAFS